MPNGFSFRLACTAAIGGLSLAAVPAAAAPAPGLEAAISAWTRDIQRLDVPKEGCFVAGFPERGWHETVCKEAPLRPFLPAQPGRRHGYTVGYGNDYGLFTSSLIQHAHGSFPQITGLTSETGLGGLADIYSLQLNSGFMKTPVCHGIFGCVSWAQFLYSSGSRAVFMQFWLIGYGDGCPSGWMSDNGGDCYINSKAVAAPQYAATSLQSLTITGTAKQGGQDAVKMTAGTVAYAVSAPDTRADLASAWMQVEYNVVGDGEGSQANFNKGTRIKVHVSVDDATTTAPTCNGDSGTTAETNNLVLGPGCTTYSGNAPSVKFTEK